MTDGGYTQTEAWNLQLQAKIEEAEHRAATAEQLVDIACKERDTHITRAATAEARLKEAGNIIGDFRKITEVVGGVRHRLPYTPPFFTDLWDKTEARSGEFLNKLKTGAHRDG